MSLSQQITIMSIIALLLVVIMFVLAYNSNSSSSEEISTHFTLINQRIAEMNKKTDSIMLNQQSTNLEEVIKSIQAISATTSSQLHAINQEVVALREALPEIAQKTTATSAWYETRRIFNEIQKKEYTCKNSTIQGGNGNEEGGWNVCFDKLMKPCVVYSFGIANDYSFDTELGNFGCKVYSFDPSMGVANHTHAPNVEFFDIGVSDVDADAVDSIAMNGTRQKWNVRTVSSLMRWFGHDKLDILKIDVEGSEWKTFNQMIKADTFAKVDQLLFEVHFWGDHTAATHRRWYDILMALKAQGFKLFGQHENPMSTEEYMGDPSGLGNRCCWELYMIRA